MAKRKSSPQDPKITELFEAKLASSGLTLVDAQLLHMHALSREQTQDLHRAYQPLISLRLDYLDPFGQPLIDWPCAPPFYRLRYLEAPTGFEAQTDKRPVRYVQAPGTAPCAYYPANQSWVNILDDPEMPLIITEGELKAAKACKEGFPTIGLGGVWNWRSSKLGIEWLDSLNYVTWAQRAVYLVFDSDMHENPHICTALHEFAEALHDRGAFAYLVRLPSLENLPKTGLDDFFVHVGPTAGDDFHELLHEAEALGLTRVLFDLNKTYIYIRHPGLIVDQHTRSKVQPGPFKEHLEAAKQYREQVVKPDGTISHKQVSAATAWLKWPLRYQADELTYQPGRPRYITNGKTKYNIWPGWGVQPVEGNIEPFLKLLDHLFTGAEAEVKHWFLCWAAYPLQHPGTKLFSSMVIHGRQHGTGKSLIGYTLGRIYGDNFTEISQMDLHNHFNEWAEAKQFAMGDDVTGSNKRADADFLKKMITQMSLRVNGKYVPSYVVPDCLNYLFNSNHPDAFFLEDDDRRFCVHEVRVGPLPEEFYVEYDLWLETGGAAAVFHYLLSYDVGGFNPAAPALKTMAKERMIVDGQSDLGSWVRALVATPEYYLKVGEIAIRRDCFTSKELLQLYDPAGATGTTANGLGRELRRAGVPLVCEGRPIRSPDGGQARYYAVRNLPQWTTALPGQIAAHLAESSPAKAGKKY